MGPVRAMTEFSLEDPIEVRGAYEQVPPGNPSDLSVGDTALLKNDFICTDGRRIVKAGSKVLVRSIAPLPTTYIATFEPMGFGGPTGELFEIALPLLVNAISD